MLRKNRTLDNLKSICRIFADDTKVINSVNNSTILQNDINKLINWTQVWDLHFNISKCKVMHMGRTNVNNDYTMTNCTGETQTISDCTEEKDLGVLFDNRLSFESHIQQVINKANKVLGIMKRTFTNMDSDIFLRLYKTMVKTASRVCKCHLVSTFKETISRPGTCSKTGY